MYPTVLFLVFNLQLLYLNSLLQESFNFLGEFRKPSFSCQVDRAKNYEILACTRVSSSICKYARIFPSLLKILTELADAGLDTAYRGDDTDTF